MNRTSVGKLCEDARPTRKDQSLADRMIWKAG